MRSRLEYDTIHFSPLIFTMQNKIPSFHLFNAQVQAFHRNAVEKGFYEAYPTLESRDDREYRTSRANLITSEISEAYEAFRKNKIQPDKPSCVYILNNFEPQHAGEPDQITVDEFINLYNSFVKGTMAEELADVYIRVCDAVGGFGMRKLNEADDFEELVNIKLENLLYQNDGNQALFWACLHIIDERIHWRAPMYKEIAMWVAAAYALANRFEIDIQTHVRIKSIYNTYRGYKHGKDF